MFGLPNRKELERYSNMISNLNEEFDEVVEEKQLDKEEIRAKLEGICHRFVSDYSYRRAIYENICSVLDGTTGTVLLVDLFPSNEKEPETEE